MIRKLPQVGQLQDFNESLHALIDDRLQQGLAPPAEIYQVQNRRKVDWSRYPDWVRPSDPDLFDGCGHEG